MCKIRRKIISCFIKKNPDKSNREISRLLNCSHNTVLDVRRHGAEKVRRPRTRPIRGSNDISDAILEVIGQNPNACQSDLAKEFGMSRKTVQNILRDLDIVSYRKEIRPPMPESTRQLRVEKATGLLNHLKRPDAGKVICFSDEKWFTLNQYHNRQNHRVLAPKGVREAVPDECRFVEKQTKSPGVLFFWHCCIRW